MEHDDDDNPQVPSVYEEGVKAYTHTHTELHTQKATHTDNTAVWEHTDYRRLSIGHCLTGAWIAAGDGRTEDWDRPRWGGGRARKVPLVSSGVTSHGVLVAWVLPSGSLRLFEMGLIWADGYWTSDGSYPFLSLVRSWRCRTVNLDYRIVIQRLVNPWSIILNQPSSNCSRLLKALSGLKGRNLKVG